MSGDSSDGLTTWALSFLQGMSEIASVIQKAQVDYPPFFSLYIGQINRINVYIPLWLTII